MTAALIAYLLAQVADVVTTERGLRRGATEANAVLRWMIDRLGRGWIVLKAALAGVAAYVLATQGSTGGVWAVAAVTGLVALRNLRALQ